MREGKNDLRKRKLLPAIPYAGMSQFRFNGYHLRPMATPASLMEMNIVEETVSVKKTSHNTEISSSGNQSCESL